MSMKPIFERKHAFQNEFLKAYFTDKRTGFRAQPEVHIVHINAQNVQPSWLGYFNGLVSKGARLTPCYAHRLLDHLVRHAPMPHDIDIRSHI